MRCGALIQLLIPAVLLGCIFPAKAFAQLNEGDEAVDYLRDIRPILSENCYACHGPDENSREADLRIDQLKSSTHETPSGNVAIVPGRPDESELYRRIASTDEDEVMPPIDTGKSITPEQTELIRRWIKEGASWKQHWAFVPPQQQELPSTKKDKLPHGPIDYFIQAELHKKGWQPSPEADKETLLRRVTFDLTGLPPTLAEVDAFLADDSPDAFQHVVERLLQSPHYGEHMARFWLDAVRYGDTHGLHLDNYREMWLYRDWVVKAFNDNMPFNQFTVEQLAGDLLPNPALDQIIATGFNRCHVSTSEGGSIIEEVYVRNVVDRVSTTGTVFLGLTLGCAVCHDHKFDPISQKEFYQLFAFFNSIKGPPIDDNAKAPIPIISVPSKEQTALIETLQQDLEINRAERYDRLRAELPEFSTWLTEHINPSKEKKLDPSDDGVEGPVFSSNFEEMSGNLVSNDAQPEKPGRIRGNPIWTEGRRGGGFKFSGDNYIDYGNVGSFQGHRPFSYGAWIRTESFTSGPIIAKLDAANHNQGYEVSVNNGIVSAELARERPSFSIKVSTKEKVLEAGSWHHVFVTNDGSREASGLVIYVDGKRVPLDVHSDSLKYKRGIQHDKPLLLGSRDTEALFRGATIDDVRLYQRRLSELEVLAIFISSQLNPILPSSQEQLSEQQLEMLRLYYLIRNDSQYLDQKKTYEELEKKIEAEKEKVPTTLVFIEKKNPRDAFVLIRGAYDQPGEKVERQTPDCLPPMSEEFSRDRLGLARWMVSNENPLTSRVAVNRFWQQLFGIGLVETSDDFGSQGTPPSHPELLDWLAVEFRESGWDVKWLLQRIVMSATYRQSSYTTTELTRNDPKNRFLARGPRFRLDAEMLRDQALEVSGLLVKQMGGPSVKPPQPDGLWKAVGYSDSNTVKFVADTGPEKVHRRSLYTFHKRTAPPPQMSTFDGPSRESSCVRRERTNTPLQALLLLNDPQYVEAARALAQRAIRLEDLSIAERVDYLYRLCTARHASEAAITELVQLYKDQLVNYQQNQSAALALTKQGEQATQQNGQPSELAAWTIVTNLLLNLDKVVNKN